MIDTNKKSYIQEVRESLLSSYQININRHLKDWLELDKKDGRKDFKKK